MEYITVTVVLTFLFLLAIHCIETLAYAVRISGARVRLIASAIALFNVMIIVSRMSNMIQQPFAGSLIDSAPNTGTLDFVEGQFRILISAASVGTIVGALLLPTFIALFSRAIIHLANNQGSIPSLFKQALSIRYLKRYKKHFHFPTLSYIKDIQIKDIPIKLFVINVLITSIYTIGVLSALFASLIAPERASSAIMASGLINGIATILLVIFIDPKISVMADDFVNKKGNYLSLKTVSVMMVSSRLIGTVVAQLIFIPAAYYIATFTQIFEVLN